MALSEIQFTVLFLGAFGQSVEDAGLELDTSGARIVARKGEHVVSLLVVQDKALEWQVDGTTLHAFEVNGRDVKSLARKSAAMGKLLEALQ